jgi:hypothetical protein
MDLEVDGAWARMRQHFEDIADPADAEVLETLEQDFRDRAQEMGAQAYLAWLEDHLSNAVRIGVRQVLPVDSLTPVLDRFYGEHVESLEAKPHLTHVPLYSLPAAVGKLGEDMESAEKDWVRAPEGMEGMRLGGPDLFVTHVAGRSMEPRIPNGSLNLSCPHPVGSRQVKIQLIQRFGVSDETARYTVKCYTSNKVLTGEHEWRHEQIRLEPLNPEFETWPQDFAVVAEWLSVIE